ncbi:NAD-dependent epimerase/dehydratase family protein [Halorubrum sp. CBA1125]|uniref:NAD-dependent epimerase/dehydratase family protein n=1 Tax=Halorubrum sp. CBA1125 TaxID=2668072 RepID=UPI00135DC5B0|nr:NAD-dependent epimerase/dehydratase family protein [Halorubrum sp. CBA1125]MUW15532.1 NAD-dependent epimerase/dehydratase family protein [Halorubrum sp. CBA1125]
MEYFVTGATGLVGTHLVEQLVAAGHDVVGLTRSRSNAAHLPEAVTVVEGDLTDKASMRRAMEGVDGVFHVGAWFYVGPGPEQAETARRVNVGGTRNVLELMDELDVPKGVYTSTVGVHPGTSGAIIDESTEPPQPTFAVYYRTKWAAHYEVAKPMMADGLPLVAVLPSAIYGPGDKLEGSMRSIFRDYLTGDLPAIPRESRLSFDYVADTARAHRLAMERGTPGEEYIIASESRSLVEVFERAEAITGVPTPRVVPAAAFGVLARVMRVVERVVTPPEGFEPELLSFAAGRRYDVDNSKARRELGLEHRPLEEGLREYLTWELEQLGMNAPVDG